MSVAAGIASLIFAFSGKGSHHLTAEIPVTTHDSSSLIDLEKCTQDFVLDSKQIVLNECPTAFNPTVVRWKGSLLIAFMLRHQKTGVVDGIGMARLDDNFDVISPVYKLNVPPCPLNGLSKQYDPRMIVIQNRLYIVYNNIISNSVSQEVRRMFLAEVYSDGVYFYTGIPEGLFNFEGEKESRWEKNWMPFDYNGELCFVYSLTPHRILKSVLDKDYWGLFAVSQAKIDWKWGYPRGGTQAYLNGDKYLAFFHSSINMATVQSNGINFPHYFFGAYTFASEPPFQITHISPEPIIGKGFYSGTPYKTWRPLRVVFPDGYVFDDEFIWILCGKQDHEIWVVKLDKRKLLESLVPVVPAK